MTEERLREFDRLTNLPDKENQVVIVTPEEIDELTAEIRRLQAEVSRLRPVFDQAEAFAEIVNVDAFEDIDLCNAVHNVVDAVDAAKAKEEA